MHPAYSVIIFTTLSGAGHGLLVLMGIFAAGQWIPVNRWFGLTGFLVAFLRQKKLKRLFLKNRKTRTNDLQFMRSIR